MRYLSATRISTLNATMYSLPTFSTKRNDLLSRGKYTDIIDELLIKLTKAKVKKIKIKEV